MHFVFFSSCLVFITFTSAERLFTYFIFWNLYQKYLYMNTPVELDLDFDTFYMWQSNINMCCLILMIMYQYVIRCLL